MTTTAGPDRFIQTWNTTTGHFVGAADKITISADPPLPIDETAKDLEMPRSGLFDHLAVTATRGGIVFLTLYGRRVAAVVPADVGEALERAEPEDERGSGLRILLADSEARLGPVPAEIQAEVDRQWAAAGDL